MTGILLASDGRAPHNPGTAASAVFFCLACLLPLASLPAQNAVVLAADSYFSPNSDGIQDSLEISIDEIPGELRRCANWKLEIQSASGRIIRTIVADRRKKNISWIPFYKGSGILKVFKEISWDGRDNRGTFVSDGYYTILLKIESLEGDTITSEPLRVTASTRKPEITLSSSQSILMRSFNENNDLVEESAPIVIEQSIRAGSAYLFEGAFLDASGSVVRRKKWEQNLPPVIYFGEDRQFFGGRLPEGIYRYRLVAEDAAGNRNAAYLNDIIIAHRPLGMDLRAKRYVFSPEARANIELEPVRLSGLSGRPAGSASSIPGDWVFLITGKPGRKPVFQSSGSGALPSRLIWNGLDEDGKPVSGGIYYAHLKKGDQETLYRPIYMDQKAPSVALGGSWHKLSPDGDGSFDSFRLTLSASDNYELESWRLYIAIEPDDSLRSIHRVFYGNGPPPSSFEWDGQGDNGELLQSGEQLSFVLEATDLAGNTRQSSALFRTTAILFRPLSPGSSSVVSRLPDQDFFDGLDELKSRGKSRIRAVIRKLSSYRRYNVQIESHASMRGDEETNLLKTELRASRIHAYFLKKGVDRDRIDFRGMGETEPLKEDSSEYYDYRNSRIEIRLHEKKKP